MIVEDAPYGCEVLQMTSCAWLSSDKIPIDQSASYSFRGKNSNFFNLLIVHIIKFIKDTLNGLVMAVQELISPQFMSMYINFN